MRAMYHELREDGISRVRAFLLAYGFWMYFPRLFPQADADVLPASRERNPLKAK